MKRCSSIRVGLLRKIPTRHRGLGRWKRYCFVADERSGFGYYRSWSQANVPTKDGRRPRGRPYYLRSAIRFYQWRDVCNVVQSKRDPRVFSVAVVTEEPAFPMPVRVVKELKLCASDGPTCDAWVETEIIDL